LKIGNDVTTAKTSGLNAKDSQDFEKFVQERKKKQLKPEEKEEKITSKMPNDEGDASAKDLAKQTHELVKEKNDFDSRHDVQLEDIERE
jgi:hypothetical protein